MTEEEAKTKWCPFARVADGVTPVAYNRSYPLEDGAPEQLHGRCFGSGCMAWRWFTYQVYVRGPGGQRIGLNETETSTTKGYCGLAGASRSEGVIS